MWYQGWNKVPDIVSKCICSWEKHNPEWQISEEDIKRFESKIDPLYELTKHYKVKPNSTMGYLLSNY